MTGWAVRAARSLLWEAEKAEVSLQGLTINNFNTFLDEAFDDGGHIRCVKFTDLLDRYALRFGPIESEPFDNAKWPLIEDAIQYIQAEMSR